VNSQNDAEFSLTGTINGAISRCYNIDFSYEGISTVGNTTAAYVGSDSVFLFLEAGLLSKNTLYHSMA